MDNTFTVDPFNAKTGAGTLGYYASKYGVSTSELQKLNGLQDPNKLSVGQILKLPTAPTPPITPSMPGNSPTPTIPDTTPDANNYGAITKSVVDLYNQPTGPAQLTDDALTAKIKDLMTQDQNKAVDQAQAEKDAGIPTLQSDIQELTDQISAIGTEQTAQELKNTQQPYSNDIIAGQNKALERDNAIKALTLSAQLKAKQGQLSIAQDQVTRALNLKYQPIEDEINNKLKLIDLNKDNLTKEQKKQADIMSAQLEDEKQKIADQKQDDSDKHSYALKVAQAGGSNALVSSIINAKTADEALGIAAASGYLKDKTTSSADAAGSKLLSITDVSNYQTLYPDAGINAGDTVASANAKVAALVGPKAGTADQFATIAQQEKDAGKTYDQVIADINGNPQIANKDVAIKAVNSVYGKDGGSGEPAPAPAPSPFDSVFGKGGFAKTSLTDALAQTKAGYAKIGYPNATTSIRDELVKKGYPTQAVADATKTGWENFTQSADQVFKKLFGLK